jgi:hypothetical protein
MLVSCGDSVEPAAEADQRAGAVVFGDPVGMAQAAGGATILTGIAVSGLPLLLARGPGRPAVEQHLYAGPEFTDPCTSAWVFCEAVKDG